MSGEPSSPRDDSAKADDGRGDNANGLGPSESQKKIIGKGKPIWVIAVVACYGLALVALLALCLIAMLDDGDTEAIITGAIVLLIVIVSQAGLLLVPVTIPSRRPVRRGSLLFPLIASGLLVGCLVAGAGAALSELAEAEALFWLFVAVAVVSWIIWVIVFYTMSAATDPTSVACRLHKSLLKGSVLELLVAVSAHIVVRRRTECSAGIMTFAGICTGLAVAFIAFGPAVVILYIDRCMHIRPVIQSGLSHAQRRRRLLLWSLLVALLILLAAWMLATGPLLR